ncbi:chromatin organization modifier domain-containing protein [Gigaspora margarita]|uniref:Chromatin organization modifier domain-containing protein n=1 Tax=Gigaspora margarita TaxID=4874 RepID=A0A8H4ATB9_GIGMA|nr:chromatin organization modifier domain-containing protein [Gigaspora margarita]
MSHQNIIPGDSAVSNSIIYGGNFFMGGNIVFGDGSSHTENGEYDIKESSKNLDDEIMDHNEVQNFSESDEDMLLSEKISWELDSWYREDSPYRFDGPEDGDNDGDIEDGGIDDDEEIDNNLEDDEYVVEKIADHRFNNDGELEYFIKWDGWEEKDNSWELSTHVFAEKLINEYWKALSIKKPFKSEPQKPMNSTKQDLSSTGLDVEVRKRSKKRNPKTVILSNKKSKKTSQNVKKSPHVTLSQSKESSENNEPKENKKSKYKKKKEKQKQPKVEANDIETGTSSDWERDIGDIESVELKDEKLVVFIAWNSGMRSMHQVEEVNKKAPQKMLSFYQHHLKIKKFVRKKRCT